MTDKIKLAVFGLIIGVVLFILLALLATQVKQTEATYTIPKVNICHCESNECNTLNIAIPASIAHLIQHEDDYAGVCEELPDICPEEGYQPYGPCEPEVCPEGTHEVKNEAWEEEEYELYCEPDEPEVVAEQPKGDNTGDPDNITPTAPTCPDVKPGDVPNIFVDSGVLNDNQVEVQWAIVPGASKVHIGYREYSEDKITHALLNTDNDGNEVIGGLKNGVNYAFSVVGVNGCAVGNWSEPFDPMP